MTKAEFTKKAPKGFSWHVRRIKRDPAVRTLEEGYERRRKLEKRIPVTSSEETNDGPVNINVLPCDQVTHKHLIRIMGELSVLRISDSKIWKTQHLA